MAAQPAIIRAAALIAGVLKNLGSIGNPDLKALMLHLREAPGLVNQKSVL
jgi:hypothetical protein